MFQLFDVLALVRAAAIVNKSTSDLLMKWCFALWLMIGLCGYLSKKEWCGDNDILVLEICPCVLSLRWCLLQCRAWILRSSPNADANSGLRWRHLVDCGSCVELVVGVWQVWFPYPTYLSSEMLDPQFD